MKGSHSARSPEKSGEGGSREGCEAHGENHHQPHDVSSAGLGKGDGPGPEKISIKFMQIEKGGLYVNLLM